eukprot:TRINITY_DN1236_c0_g1_i2.p2 TRINITY_DN1236_c0_g1~~TRINITY_DN1236_c0_g1_i2.p2  ORF type:complete len:198 (-),score=43.90 TRINITY_DN1236_c0_g1_i2:1227-1820(-)
MKGKGGEATDSDTDSDADDCKLAASRKRKAIGGKGARNYDKAIGGKEARNYDIPRVRVYSYKAEDGQKDGPVREGLIMHSVDTVNEVVELIHSFYGVPQETMVLLYAFDDGCGGPLQIEQLRNPYANTVRPYADDNEVVDVDMPWREPYSGTVRHYLRFMTHDVTIEPSKADGWCVPTVIECENRKDKVSGATRDLH